VKYPKKMGQVSSNFRLIIDDIKHSWYFRVWSFLWIFSVVFTFAVLILLGQTSTRAQMEPTFSFWRENVSTINFPRFRFFSPNFTIEAEVQCNHNGKVLNTVACTPRHDGRQIPMSHCQAVESEGEIAENKHGAFRERVISCVLNTFNTSDRNYLISFELEGTHIAHYGANSHFNLWIGPNNNTWVLLDKSYITYQGRPTLEEWERELVYHSTVWHHGKYVVSVIINRFFVTHGEQGLKYDPWRALGEIGGFAYFLLLLHGLMMMFVGICFNNDAKILIGESGGYAAFDSSEERRNML